MKPEQRESSTVLSPIPMRLIARALLTGATYTNARIWNPFWQTRQPEMSCRSNPVPFRFSRTRVTGVLPIASSKGCFWCFVCSESRTDGRLSVQHRMAWNVPLGVTTFLAPERNVKTNVQKVHIPLAVVNVNFIIRVQLNNQFIDLISLFGIRLHQQKCSQKMLSTLLFLSRFRNVNKGCLSERNLYHQLLIFMKIRRYQYREKMIYFW